MRSPRKTFTAPFVITTVVGAIGSAGFTSCNPPAQRPPDPMIGKNPPAPDPGPQPTGPAEGEKRWSVYKQGADCFAMAQFDCPKPANPGGPVPTCNPPPASKYTCPDNVSLDVPIDIAQWAGEATCHVVPAPISCPEGAMCNPPPPMQVACPTP